MRESSCVIDLGAREGAATGYIALSEPKVSFVAADYVSDYCEIGRKLAVSNRIDNIAFRQVDWFSMSETSEFDGVISLQTMSWLPELRTPLEQVFTKLKPNWFAITSLFYDGDISCTVEINKHTDRRKSFYNIYSLKEASRIANEYGYHVSQYEKFEIPLDLPKPANPDLMGTYTKNVCDDTGACERLQISGPLLMPWYMVLIEKLES